MPNVTHLECSLCGLHYEAGRVHNLCSCGGALLVRYDLDAIGRAWKREDLSTARPDMWRYAPALPANGPAASLGEGLTPLVRTERLGARQLWVKDEGLNPTGSFKARGLSCAITLAR